MKVGRKFYKGYCSKMRLTKNQIILAKTVVNNDNELPLDTLLAMGFNKSMVDCLVKKSALWVSRDGTVFANPLRMKGYKLIDPSFIIKAKAIAA